MKLSKYGGAVLILTIVLTLIWMMATPRVVFISLDGGVRGCTSDEINRVLSRCVAHTTGMVFRFLVGFAASATLAVGVSALGGKR